MVRIRGVIIYGEKSVNGRGCFSPRFVNAFALLFNSATFAH
jgi:hypothetical protein